MSQAMLIVAKKLQEIAQIADALDATAAHLIKAQAKQERLIKKLKQKPPKSSKGT